MVLCTMGTRHCWLVSPSDWEQKICLVTIDYLTKWVEAEALAKIWDVDVKKFF